MGKYDHINFTPPKSVQEAAKRGLELRKKNKGKGGLSTQEAGKQGIGSGVARATSLSNGKKQSPETIRMMYNFFNRHEKSKKIDPGKKPHEDKGKIAWDLWGGDAGRSWSSKIYKQMETADKKKSNASEALDDLTDQIYALASKKKKTSKAFKILMKLAEEIEGESCCKLMSGGVLEFGCSQMSKENAKEKAKNMIKRLAPKLTMLEFRWDSSGVPAYSALYKIVNGEGVSMQERKAAVTNLESRFPGVIDKCEYIAVLNGWPKW